MATLKCSINKFSCGLACVESVLADNNIFKTQVQMIADYGGHFAEWVTQPGLTSPDACEAILKMAGLAITTVEPTTVGEINLRFNEAKTVGALIFASRFYEDPATRKSLSDFNHILRITIANGEGIEVMNPYRCPVPGAIENYTWQEFLLFQGGVLVFQK